jgi:predicted DNA-binding transcriptional regulator YafY
VAADLEVSVDELKADVRLLNLVNFGGDGAIVYAEFERGRLRVTCDLAGPAFASPARLSPLQADVLLLAVELVGGQLPVRHGVALRAAARKLAAARSATPPALGATDALPLEEGVLDAVNDAIRRRRLLQIEYWSEGTGRSSRRVVEPYLLVRSRGEWYYVSYCRTSEGRRTFRVATTKRVVVLDEGFTPRVDMELDLYRREGIPGSERYASRTAAVWYAAAVEAFDRRLPELIAALDGGVMFITGDHGCDPTTPSTDHSRERTPLLAAGLEGGPFEIGTRDGFGDLGCTIAELLGAGCDGMVGSSFADRIGVRP